MKKRSEGLTLDDFYGNSSALAETESHAGTSKMSVNETVLLLGKLSAEFTLINPIQLAIEKDADGAYLASDDIFFVYGAGRTLQQALDDYVVSLIDYYELHLAETAINRAALPGLRKLQKYLFEVNAAQAA